MEKPPDRHSHGLFDDDAELTQHSMPGQSVIVGWYSLRDGTTSEPGVGQDLDHARLSVSALLDEYGYLWAYCFEIQPSLKDEPEKGLVHVAWEVNAYTLFILDCLQDAVPSVQRVMRLLDAHSQGPVRLGTHTSSNAHAAVVGLGLQVQQLSNAGQFSVLPFDQQNDQVVVNEWLNRNLPHLTAFVNGIRGMPTIDADELLALIRIESAGGVSSSPGLVPPPPPPPTFPLIQEEIMVLDALRKHSKPMLQGNLLDAAKLKRTGPNNQLLAWMRQRGLLNNKGKGFYLPEWDKP
jgi:hypothetical protein